MKITNLFLGIVAAWFIAGSADFLIDRSQAIAADQAPIEAFNESGTRKRVGHTSGGVWTMPLPVIDIGRYASVVTQQVCNATVDGITVVDGDYYYIIAVTAVTLDFIATGSFKEGNGFVLPTAMGMKVVANGTTLSCFRFNSTNGWVSVIALD